MFIRFLVLLILSISFFNIGCHDNFSPKIPDHIITEVVVSPIPTPVIVVRHEIVISVEMEQVFVDQCALDFNKDTQEYKDCINIKKAEFIEQFMNLLNNQNLTGGTN